MIISSDKILGHVPGSHFPLNRGQGRRRWVPCLERLSGPHVNTQGVHNSCTGERRTRADTSDA